MDAEWIVILVALGLSVLSGINKNKKKKTGQQSQHQPYERTEDEDDPWATIRRYIEDANDEGTQEELLTTSEPEPVRQSVVKAEPQAAERNQYISALNEYARQKSIEQKAAANKKGREHIHIPAPAPMQNISDAEVSEDIMAGFDLRKAVIYSEILKPKFKDA